MDIKYPYYGRDENLIVKFLSATVGTVVMSSEKGYPIGYYSNTWRESKYWDKVPTQIINGITYFDTQPIWVFNEDECIRLFAFFDAKHNSIFTPEGTRGYSDITEHFTFENLKPVETFEPWMGDAWKTLEYKEIK